jgi:penicillin-binding protein 2
MTHLSGNEAPIDGRLRLAAVLLILVFMIFGLRLFQLQIIEGAELRKRSERNSVRTVRLEAPRGEIVDREGRTLAGTRPARELEVIPNDLQDRGRTFAALAQLLDRDAAALDERVGSPGGSRRFRPVELVDDLDFDELARVEAHAFAMPGVRTTVRPRRHYLEGSLLAHGLGTIGEIRSGQLEKEAFSAYRSGDVIGQSGLESRFEDHLRGSAGGRNVVVDVAGREVEVLAEVAPSSGGRLVLAIDLDLQREAEAGFLDVAEGEPAQMGAAVALDVKNGDVLVLASMPSYDPNSFAGGIDAESWDALTTHAWKPLRNRATQNHYPQGSTHKALVAAALLEEGVIDRNTTAFCPGFYRYGNRNYRCWKREGHGTVDVRTALQRSCDVFFYTFGVKLGIDRMARHLTTFGLGSPTGVELGGEASGVVPSSAWKKKQLGEPWYPGETVSASIGQGYNLVTPLQLAVAYAAIANGGKLLRPRLVLRLEDRDGVPERHFPVEDLGDVSVGPSALGIVRDGLMAVVEETRGTGSRARVEGVKVGGKTGTVQVVSLDRTEGLEDEEIPVRFRDHAWFAAFAPVEDPEIAVAVFVEHGLHGSSAAAPIAQRILQRYFDKQRGVPAPVVAEALDAVD